jgi:NAD(P)-dependent dehydrogenase (short-subunit alcohol dehydrogenase family)
MALSIDGINLTSQVALVTGGGRGIGRATALALSRAGAAVAIAARSEDQLRETARLIESTGGCVVAQPADVTDQKAVEALVAIVEERLGTPDLLVNNAAIVGDYGPTWEADPALWWRVMEVNVLGPFLCARAVLPGMVARRRGRIINLSSGTDMGPFPHSGAYAISKVAITRFTENLCGEVLGYGISVFSLNPGSVRTAMSQHVMNSPGGQKWQPGLRQLYEAGRDDPPDKAADLVVYLASGQADVLTGRLLSVSFDVPEMVRRADEIKQKDLYRLRLRIQATGDDGS